MIDKHVTQIRGHPAYKSCVKVILGVENYKMSTGHARQLYSNENLC
jgi:hypothetical protein